MHFHYTLNPFNRGSICSQPQDLGRFYHILAELLSSICLDEGYNEDNRGLYTLNSELIEVISRSKNYD